MPSIPGLTAREPAHAYLPPGYSDPTNVQAFVAEEDRAYYPYDEPDTDAKLVRDVIRDDRDVSRTVRHQGRVYSAAAKADSDFEVIMHWRKCGIAEERRRNAENLARQEANASL